MIQLCSVFNKFYSIAYTGIYFDGAILFRRNWYRKISNWEVSALIFHHQWSRKLNWFRYFCYPIGHVWFSGKRSHINQSLFHFISKTPALAPIDNQRTRVWYTGYAGHMWLGNGGYKWCVGLTSVCYSSRSS